jgi:hypothetical protein
VAISFIVFSDEKQTHSDEHWDLQKFKISNNLEYAVGPDDCASNKKYSRGCERGLGLTIPTSLFQHLHFTLYPFARDMSRLRIPFTDLF